MDGEMTPVKITRLILAGIIGFFSLVDAGLSTFLSVRMNSPDMEFTPVKKAMTIILCLTSWWTWIACVAYIFLYLAIPELLMVVRTQLYLWLGTWMFWTIGTIGITAAFGGGLDCMNFAVSFPNCGHVSGLQAISWLIWVIMLIHVSLLLFYISKEILAGQEAQQAAVAAGHAAGQWDPALPMDEIVEQKV